MIVTIPDFFKEFHLLSGRGKGGKGPNIIFLVISEQVKGFPELYLTTSAVSNF